jgi:hypothetical protein
LTGSLGDASFETFIADSGEFDGLCTDETQDLNLTIQSNGSCDLEIDSISLSGADAADFELPSGSFAGTVIETGNSLQVPIRFAPANTSDPNPRVASVDVDASTLGGTALPQDQTPVEGATGLASITTFIADSGEFGLLCSEETQDLNLTIQSDGSCPLRLDSILLSGTDEADFELPDGSFAGTIIEAGNSLVVPVRFAPANTSDPNPRNASVDILASTPGGDALALDETPISGATGLASMTTFIADSGDFGLLCAEEFQDLNLTIQSDGSCPLQVDSVLLTGTDEADFNLPDGSLAGTIIEAGNSLVVPVRFAPANTSDPNPRNASVDIMASTPGGDALALDETPIFGATGLASILTFIADSGNFGNICSGDLHDLNMTIQSNGSCPLQIDSVLLSGVDMADFELPTGSLVGTIIEPGNSLLVPVRFTPDNFTDPNPRVASVDVSSSTPGGDALALNQTPIEGTVPPPDINLAIANDGNFGEVCKGGFADLDLTLFNQGMCDLEISNIELLPPVGSFILPSDLDLPLILSPDADFMLPVRYAPVVCSDIPEAAQILITSDDPDEGEEFVDISGVSPCPNLVIDPWGLTGDFAFPATVRDLDGSLGCYSERIAVLRNTGNCPLTIDSISALDDFRVMTPSVFPVVLPTGEETLEVTVRFEPQSGGDPLAPDEFLGELTIVSDDPDIEHTAELCGEGVAQSGIRVLTTNISSGIPLVVDGVDNITIRSKGKKTPSPIHLQFTDVPVQSAAICGNTVTWHVDQETLPSTQTTGSNPKSSYQVSAKEGNLQDSQSFSLGQCEFLEFQLELLDSDAPACLLLPKGAACTVAGECCSGKCKGPAGGKTCK